MRADHNDRKDMSVAVASIKRLQAQVLDFVTENNVEISHLKSCITAVRQCLEHALSDPEGQDAVAHFLDLVQKMSVPEAAAEIQKLLENGFIHLINLLGFLAVQQIFIPTLSLNQLLECIHVLADTAQGVKSFMVKKILARYIQFALDVMLSFGIRLEFIKASNYLVEQCAKATKLELLEDETFVNKLKTWVGLVFEIGDYEFQVSVIEGTFRLLPRKERTQFANFCFENEEMCSAYMKIRENHFETDCRLFLNKVNDGTTGPRTVYSIPCEEAYLGSKQLKKPSGPECQQFWVDFNVGSQRITLFYEQDTLESECSEDDEMWETLSVLKSDVKVYSCLCEGGLDTVSFDLVSSVAKLYPALAAGNHDSRIVMRFNINYNVEMAVSKIFENLAVATNQHKNQLRKISTVLKPVVVSKNNSQEEITSECDSASQPMSQTPSDRRFISSNQIPTSHTSKSSLTASYQQGHSQVSETPMRCKISVPAQPMTVPNNNRLSHIAGQMEVRTAPILQGVSKVLPSEIQKVDSTSPAKSIAPKVSSSDSVKIHSANPSMKSTPKSSIRPKAKVKTPVVTVTSKTSKRNEGSILSRDAVHNDCNHSKYDLSNGCDVDIVPDSMPVDHTQYKNKETTRETECKKVLMATAPKQMLTPVCKVVEDKCSNSKQKTIAIADSTCKTSKEKHVSEEPNDVEVTINLNMSKTNNGRRKGGRKPAAKKKPTTNTEAEPRRYNTRHSSQRSNDSIMNDTTPVSQSSNSQMSSGTPRRQCVNIKTDKFYCQSSIPETAEQDIKMTKNANKKNANKKLETFKQTSIQDQSGEQSCVREDIMETKVNTGTKRNKKGGKKNVSATQIDKKDVCCESSPIASCKTNVQKDLPDITMTCPSLTNSPLIVKISESERKRADKQLRSQVADDTKHAGKQKSANPDQSSYQFDFFNVAKCMKSKPDRTLARRYRTNDLASPTGKNTKSKPEICNEKQATKDKVAITDKKVKSAKGSSNEGFKSYMSSSFLQKSNFDNDSMKSDSDPYEFGSSDCEIVGTHQSVQNKKKSLHQTFSKAIVKQQEIHNSVQSFSIAHGKGKKEFHVEMENKSCMRFKANSLDISHQSTKCLSILEKRHQTTSKRKDEFTIYEDSICNVTSSRTLKDVTKINMQQNKILQSNCDVEIRDRRKNGKAARKKAFFKSNRKEQQERERDVSVMFANESKSKTVDPLRSKKALYSKNESMLKDIFNEINKTKKSKMASGNKVEKELRDDSQDSISGWSQSTTLKKIKEKIESAGKENIPIRGSNPKKPKPASQLLQAEGEISLPSTKDSESSPEICRNAFTSREDENNDLAGCQDSMVASFSQICQSIIAESHENDTNRGRRKRKTVNYRDLSDSEIDDDTYSSTKKSIGKTPASSIMNLTDSNEKCNRSEISWLASTKTKKLKAQRVTKTYRHRKQCTTKIEEDYSVVECIRNEDSGTDDFTSQLLQKNYFKATPRSGSAVITTSNISTPKTPNLEPPSEDDEGEQNDFNGVLQRFQPDESLKDVDEILSLSQLKTPTLKNLCSTLDDNDEIMRLCQMNTPNIGLTSSQSTEDHASISDLKTPDLGQVNLFDGSEVIPMCNKWQKSDLEIESQDSEEESPSYSGRLSDASRLQPKRLTFIAEQREHLSKKTLSSSGKASEDSLSQSYEDELQPIHTGINTFVQTFGLDIQKQIKKRQQQLESITSSTVRSTQKWVTNAYKKQMQTRSKVMDDFNDKMALELLAIEKDINSLKEAEDKTLTFFRQQMKVIENCRYSQEKRLTNLKHLQLSLTHCLKEAEEESTFCQKTVHTTLKNEMADMQKRILRESHQHEIANVRRCLHSLFD